VDSQAVVVGWATWVVVFVEDSAMPTLHVKSIPFFDSGLEREHFLLPTSDGVREATFHYHSIEFL
jgi:hypothetical protein